MTSPADKPDLSRLGISIAVVSSLLLWVPVWWYTTCSGQRPLWGTSSLEQRVRAELLHAPAWSLPCDIRVVVLNPSAGSEPRSTPPWQGAAAAAAQACPSSASRAAEGGRDGDEGAKECSAPAPAHELERGLMKELAREALDGVCAGSKGAPGCKEAPGLQKPRGEDEVSRRGGSPWATASAGPVTVHVALVGPSSPAALKELLLQHSQADDAAGGGGEGPQGSAAPARSSSSSSARSSAGTALGARLGPELDRRVHEVLLFSAEGGAGAGAAAAGAGTYWVLVVPEGEGEGDEAEEGEGAGAAVRAVTGAFRHAWLLWRKAKGKDAQQELHALARAAGIAAARTLAHGCGCGWAAMGRSPMPGLAQASDGAAGQERAVRPSSPGDGGPPLPGPVGPAVVSDSLGPAVLPHARVILLHPAPLPHQPLMLWDAKRAAEKLEQLAQGAFVQPVNSNVGVETLFYGPGELPCVPIGEEGHGTAPSSSFHRSADAVSGGRKKGKQGSCPFPAEAELRRRACEAAEAAMATGSFSGTVPPGGRPLADSKRPFLVVVPPPPHFCSLLSRTKGEYDEAARQVQRRAEQALPCNQTSLTLAFSCGARGSTGVLWAQASAAASCHPAPTPHSATALPVARQCCLVAPGGGSNSAKAVEGAAGQEQASQDLSRQSSPSDEPCCCPESDPVLKAALRDHVRGLVQGSGGARREDTAGSGTVPYGRMDPVRQEGQPSLELEVESLSSFTERRRSHLTDTVNVGERSVAEGSGGDRGGGPLPFSEWEVDAALRRRLQAAQELLKERLGLLLTTLDAFGSMPFPREPQDKVKRVLDLAAQARAATSQATPRAQDLDCGLSWLPGGLYAAWQGRMGEALALASEALSHPSMLLPSFNPWEHYLAVYSPLLLPLFLHGVVSLVKEVRLLHQGLKKTAITDAT